MASGKGTAEPIIGTESTGKVLPVQDGKAVFAGNLCPEFEVAGEPLQESDYALLFKSADPEFSVEQPGYVGTNDPTIAVAVVGPFEKYAQDPSTLPTPNTGLAIVVTRGGQIQTSFVTFSGTGKADKADKAGKKGKN